MSGFTKGPWEAEDGGVYAEGMEPNRHVIVADCVCDEFQRRAPPEHIDANAALIAAAPEMFEALQTLLGSCELVRNERGEHLVDPHSMADARAALAKAAPSEEEKT